MIPPLQALAFTCPSLFLLTCHSISFWITTQLHLFYQVTHDIHTTNYHFKQYDHCRPSNVLRTKLKERRCNGAMSSVHRDPYKAGVRQTCTNRPNVESSVLINNSSLHCSYPSRRVAFHYISWFSASRIGWTQTNPLNVLKTLQKACYIFKSHTQATMFFLWKV